MRYTRFQNPGHVVIFFAGNISKPLEPAPFPNRLTAVDLNQSVLKHMATRLEFRLGEVLRLVTSNFPCSATATYHLLLRKLQRYDTMAQKTERGAETAPPNKAQRQQRVRLTCSPNILA